MVQGEDISRPRARQQGVCSRSLSKREAVRSAGERGATARQAVGRFRTRPGNHPPGCGALWEMAQLGKRARGTTRQAAGRFRTRPGNHPPDSGALWEMAQLGKRVRGTTRQAAGRFHTRPGNHPPGCGALWEMAQLGKRARGTTRQAAGRFRMRSRRSFATWCALAPLPLGG